MKLKTGDMWKVYDEADMFLITTNSFIKQNGALVMGAGIAKQARDKFPGIDLALGSRIQHLGTYGLLLSENWPERKLGAFQVKLHFKDSASLQLIEYSCKILTNFIVYNGLEHDKIHLNFPGIGNGKLEIEDVFPIVEKLPDCVTLWQYDITQGYDYTDPYFYFGN